MKRLCLLLACLLALPLAAQPMSSFQRRALPGELYAALVQLPQLRYEQKQLRGQGQELSAEKQTLLARYEQTAKGMIVVEAGYPGCAPCANLLRVLESSADSGVSMLDEWSAKGVQFYQLQWLEDRTGPEGQTFSSVWEIKSVPTLFIFKDGSLMTADLGLGLMQSRLNGFDSGQAPQTLDILRKWTAVAGY